MKPQLQSIFNLYKSTGLRVEVTAAPPSAVTFDKMVLVYNELGKIRFVYFYSEADDKFLARF